MNRIALVFFLVFGFPLSISKSVSAENAAVYHLACIQECSDPVSFENRNSSSRIVVFHMDESLNTIRKTSFSVPYPVLSIKSGGEVLFLEKRRLSHPRTRIYSIYISEPLESTVNQLFNGPSENNFLMRDNTIHNILEVSREDLVRGSYAYLVGAGVLSPTDTYPVRVEMGTFDANTGRPFLSPSLDYLLLKLRIEDKALKRVSTTSGSLRSNQYDVLLSYDIESSTFRHIAGSEKDRYFYAVSGGDSIHGARILFYRIENFSSVEAYLLDAPEISREGGFEVCLYDYSQDTLQVLTNKGYRTRVYPENSIIWSPDGSKFLFGHSREPFTEDRASNEFEGVYVFNMKTKTYQRPTSKYPEERAIAWASDNIHYIIARFSLHYNYPNRPAEPSGYFIVNSETAEMRPVIVFNEDTYPRKLEHDNGMDDFRDSLVWSPDGKYIAFYANFFQHGIKHDGVFCTNADGHQEYKLVEAAPIYEEVTPDNRCYYALTWLNY